MSEEMALSTNNLTEVNNRRLTPVDEKCLWAMINPEYYGLSISERCKKEGISRPTYHSRLKDPEFMALVNKASVDLIKDKAADILAASVKVATSSGARGYQDRRMLLEMLGLVVKENDNRILIVNIGE